MLYSGCVFYKSCTVFFINLALNIAFPSFLCYTESTDSELFDSYGLEKREIELIQKTMRPLGLETDDIDAAFYKGDRSPQNPQ